MSDDVARPDRLEVGLLVAVAVVAVSSSVALVLAHLGVHSWWLVAAITVAVAAPTGWCLRHVVRAAPRPAVVLPGVAVALVAAALSFPGFDYATGDKDPGIYVLHASSIAATGDLTISPSELQRSGAITVEDVPGAQWRAFDRWGDRIIPSFYHLWPSFLAVAVDAVGLAALGVVLPAVGVLCALLAYALGRRLFGTTAGVVGGLVLATNMMQVWQTKYPTAEVFGQSLFLGAALALVLALAQRSAALGAICGALVAIGFANRGEVVALVLLTAAAATVAIILRTGSRIGWGVLGGLLGALPLPLWQAYWPAARYSAVNGVTGRSTVLGLLGLALIAGLASRLVPERVVDAVAIWLHRVSRPAGWIVAAGVVVGAGISFLRPALFGTSYRMRNGELIRSYDEWALWRLAWFFTWPGLALAIAAAVWVLARRPRLDRLLVIGTCLGFLALFLVAARNSPQMMWWNRRFVPIAVPGLALLVGASVAAAHDLVADIRQARRWLVPAVWIGVAIVIASQGWQSVALVGHDEKAGSAEVARSVAAFSGPERGVFVWEVGPCCAAPHHLFGSATWILGDVDSILLPRERSEHPAYVDSIHAAVPGQPIFTVYADGAEPEPSTTHVYEFAGRITGSLDVWVERTDTRPDRAEPMPYDITVYRVRFRD